MTGRPARQTLVARIVAIMLFLFAIAGFVAGFRQIADETLLVLAYHGVPAEPVHPWEISPASLSGQLDRLAEHGYEAMAPEQFEAWHRGELRGGRRFLLTFDDGYQSTAAVMEQLRATRGIRSVLFLALDHVDRPEGVTASTVMQLVAAGHRVELHGRRHVSLTSLASAGADLVADLKAGRAELARWLGRDPEWLAYPFGDYDPVVRAAVASAGFTRAFTIAGTAVVRAADPLQTPRLMYLSTAAEAGEPVLAHWLPPLSARQGGLTLTLAFLLTLLGLRQWMRVPAVRGRGGR